MLTQEHILNALRDVKDPDLNRDIVTLDFVKNIKICGGNVSFEIELTTPACPVKEKLQTEAEAKVKALPGVEAVRVAMTSQVRAASAHGKSPLLTQVKNVIAVASGKGGVGKSTVSVNMALALAASGAKVGLMDADVYGPSMGMMLGLDQSPEVTADKKIVPLKKYDLEVISMGVLAGPDTPVIWRGPMVSNLIQQFLSVVAWGPLDYMIIDLPPGTGDIQLTLTQQAPLAGAVIVTTPQDISLLDARKGLLMFDQVRVPVLGIVENMSTFICGHCRKPTDIFGTGGGKKLSEFFGLPLLGQIPLDPNIVIGGDRGTPLYLQHPKSVAAMAYREAAQNMAAELSVINSTQYALPSDFKLIWKSPEQRTAGAAP